LYQFWYIYTVSGINFNIFTMYSTKEAARILGISDRRVRKLLSEGRIKGRKLGGTWVIMHFNYHRKREHNYRDAAEIDGGWNRRR